MRGKAAGLQARLQMLLEEDAALHDLMQHYGQAVGCLRLLQAIGAHEAAHQEDMVRLGRLTLPLSLTLPPTPTPTPTPNPNPNPTPNQESRVALEETYEALVLEQLAPMVADAMACDRVVFQCFPCVRVHQG